jgi:hypothetical protein
MNVFPVPERTGIHSAEIYVMKIHAKNCFGKTAGTLPGFSGGWIVVPDAVRLR